MNFRFWGDEFWILGMGAHLNSRYKGGSKGGTFLFAEAKDLFSCKLKDAVLAKSNTKLLALSLSTGDAKRLEWCVRNPKK